MDVIMISLIFGLLCINVTARPTFDVIADIIHDLVHDPNQPSNHRPPSYINNGAYLQNGYNHPAYTQGSYAFTPRPQPGGGYYPNNYPNGYHTSNHQSTYYPPTGSVNYGSNAIYDNQGVYRGPPYPATQSSGYSYNRGFANSPQYGYNRGYP